LSRHTGVSITARSFAPVHPGPVAGVVAIAHHRGWKR
jgi:hypothetical protein